MALTDLHSSNSNISGSNIQWTYDVDQYKFTEDMTVNKSAITTPANINITPDTTFEFYDGTKISGKTLCKYFKILEHIIAKDYPEELL